MNKKIKTKWLSALRSGEYKQIGSALHVADGYCCLGVLCRVMYPGEEWTVASHGTRLAFRGKFTIPPDEILEQAEMNRQQAKGLAQLNDGGASFGAIANKIESKL